MCPTAAVPAPSTTSWKSGQEPRCSPGAKLSPRRRQRRSRPSPPQLEHVALGNHLVRRRRSGESEGPGRPDERPAELQPPAIVSGIRLSRHPVRARQAPPYTASRRLWNLDSRSRRPVTLSMEYGDVGSGRSTPIARCLVQVYLRWVTWAAVIGGTLLRFRDWMHNPSLWLDELAVRETSPTATSLS